MPGELTPEQVMEQLRTRGFEAGGFRSPLRHFRGKMDSITGSMVQRGAMTQARLEVNYNFSDVEVIESTEPYPFPVAQISLLHSNRTKSAMGVLGASIDRIINVGLGDNAPQEQVKNQDFLIGKVQEWKLTPGHMMWDAEAKVETPRECWEVVMVKGTGEVAPTTTKATDVISPAQQALNLLDGKTIQQFNNVVFQDPLIKEKGGRLIGLIIDGTFVKSLETAGTVTKDENGIYHKAVERPF